LSLSHSKLLEEIRNYAAYRRTLRELRSLPLDTRLDLDICRDEIPEIAQKAVYGN